MNNRKVDKYWPEPKYRGIGFYSDASMYIDVLNYGKNKDFFTRVEVEQLLSNRVKGLRFSSNISKTAFRNLLFELKEFRWISYYYEENYRRENFHKGLINKDRYNLTFIGEQVLSAYTEDYRTFYNALVKELNDLYTIPSWFIQRLWDLNPDQGQIIVPSPRKSWNPQKRKWADREWNNEIESIVSETWDYIKKILPAAFPYQKADFVKDTSVRWMELGSSKPRKSREKSTEFTPRKRLSQSMREATVRKFFGNLNPKTEKSDFQGHKSPLLPRTYSYWCARLEELGLINYTDYNAYIPGRIIYPVSTYKKEDYNADLFPLRQVRNLDNYTLSLFQPSQENKEFVKLFISTLHEEYYKLYLLKKSLYVSIQDVRDEVCRLLKLSSELFSRFLERIVFLSDNTKEVDYRISLETDIREDQKSGSQILRTPVYFNKKIITLIAITKII